MNHGSNQIIADLRWKEFRDKHLAQLGAPAPVGPTSSTIKPAPLDSTSSNPLSLLSECSVDTPAGMSIVVEKTKTNDSDTHLSELTQTSHDNVPSVPVSRKEFDSSASTLLGMTIVLSDADQPTALDDKTSRLSSDPSLPEMQVWNIDEE